MLRVVEVHRTAEGGWELVEGAPKLLHSAPAAGAAFEIGGGGAAGDDGLPRFRPLADLFAECLAQDSQADAAFAGVWALQDAQPRVAGPSRPALTTQRPCGHPNPCMPLPPKHRTLRLPLNLETV